MPNYLADEERYEQAIAEPEDIEVDYVEPEKHHTTKTIAELCAELREIQRSHR